MRARGRAVDEINFPVMLLQQIYVRHLRLDLLDIFGHDRLKLFQIKSELMLLVLDCRHLL